jgi:hypothetical protein
MTADTIRSTFVPDFAEAEWMPNLQVKVLIEVAAQLAEANDLKRKELGFESEPEPVLAPYMAVRLTDAAWVEIRAIIDTARKVSESSHLLSNSTGLDRENLERLGTLLDSYDSVPF